VNPKSFPLFSAILAMTIAGCASAPPRIEPVAGEHQSVSYDRGQLKLVSVENHLIGLTLVDYSADTVIIGVSVSNAGDKPFNFSESNVTGELVSGDETLPADINKFESVSQGIDAQEYDAMKEAGLTSMSVGSLFVPFGSIAISAARLLLSLGELGGTSDANNINKETLSQLRQIYLRRHTLLPGTSYGGLLKVSLPDELEAGDFLVFRVTAEEEVQTFKFLCNPTKE
jgi:hypothetical protein